MGLSAKTFFPLGLWLTKLAGHSCQGNPTPFPSLFGEGSLCYEEGIGSHQVFYDWDVFSPLFLHFFVLIF